MKQLKLLTAFILLTISVLLFFSISLTSCRKNANNELAALNIVNTADSAYNNSISYKLIPVMPAQPSFIQWESGHLNTRQIIFNATKTNGDAMEQAQYKAWALHTVDILAEANLGVLNVPTLRCEHGSFSVELGQSESASALMLNGYYVNPLTDLAPRRVPVKVIINEPVTVNSVWLHDVAIDKSNYIAAIQFSLDQLMTGIDANMMNTAEIIGNNGVILISATTNQNLYSIIISNLENNRMNVQFWPQLVNSALPATQ